MTTMKRSKMKNSPITSIKDLKHRQELVRTQIDNLENRISQEYHHIIDTLTFKNFFQSVSRDLASSNMAIGKAFAIGKFLIERRKKRKTQHQLREEKKK